jgi:hypothetical protein
MSRSIGAARGAAMVVALSLLGFAAAPAVAARRPGSAATARKTVIVYGDSVVYESSHEIATAFAATKKWSYHVRAYIALAPCDYLPMLRADLAALHPAVVVIQTMGNDLSACMTRVTTDRRSPAYFAKYRADLHALFRDASRAGAKVQFLQPLPVLAAEFNAALNRIGAIAKAEAAKFKGVKVSAGPRNAVTDAGKFTLRKACLPGETRARGCTAANRILVRAPDHVHLCPIRLVNGCAVYSSGAVRFAAAVVDAVTEK